MLIREVWLRDVRSRKCWAAGALWLSGLFDFWDRKFYHYIAHWQQFWNSCPIATESMPFCQKKKYIYIYIYTGYKQKNGAVSKVNKKFISHLTRAQRTPSAAATVQVSQALVAVRFSCLLRGRLASFQDGVAARKGFMCAPFWGVQICDYSATWASCTV